MASGGATWRNRLRAVSGPLAFFLLFLLGGAALLRMDPFGLTRLTKMYSQDLLAAAMAGCYPGAPEGPCTKEGRAAISVVLLRDSDLRAFEEPWPPSYGFHARVLKAIRANRPKAVMLDIVFEDVRDDPSIEALAAELDRYRAAGIPVYAATFGVDRPLRPEVAARVRPVLVPKSIDPLDRVTRFYQLATDPPQSLATAVPTVFQDVCGGCPGPEGCGGGPIRVFWSDLPAQSWNEKWLDCRRRPSFLEWVVQDRGTEFRENCPATPTVPVRQLLEPTEEADIAIEGMVEGGVVFYGAFYHGAADAMNTPLHNDLPAVYLHAAALDNLVTLGPEAVRHRDRLVPLLGVSLPDFLMLVLVGAFLAWRRGSSRLRTAWTRLMQRVRSRVVRVVLIVFGSQIGLLVLLCGITAWLACRVGVSEWLLGVNFLFAITWTEVLDVTGKLVEAADEFESKP
jgi:CHASE2 domain-containing sensor protein